MKVQICIKAQSQYKLTNGVDRVLASYKHFLSELKSMIEVHELHFIGLVEEVR